MKLKLEDLLIQYVRPLQQPCLERISSCGCSWYTDKALEERSLFIGFTERLGGYSKEPYQGLNLASHVGDERAHVNQNREALKKALSAYAGTTPHSQSLQWINPHQTHEDTIGMLEPLMTQEDLHALEEMLATSCDALVRKSPLERFVAPCNQDAQDSVVPAPLLCFADCVPVIIVSPLGSCAVIHAGWRGVVNGIALQALEALYQADVDVSAKLLSLEEYRSLSEVSYDQLKRSCFLLEQYQNLGKKKHGLGLYNCYIGPHIRSCCFEVDSVLVSTFVGNFGPSVVKGESHISLEEALRGALTSKGIDSSRIASLGLCTSCNTDKFYSYRAEDGMCGRHAAFACMF